MSTPQAVEESLALQPKGGFAHTLLAVLSVPDVILDCTLRRVDGKMRSEAGREYELPTTLAHIAEGAYVFVKKAKKAGTEALYANSTLRQKANEELAKVFGAETTVKKIQAHYSTAPAQPVEVVRTLCLKEEEYREVCGATRDIFQTCIRGSFETYGFGPR